MKYIYILLILCMSTYVSAGEFVSGMSQMITWGGGVNDTLWSVADEADDTSDAYTVTPDMSFQKNVVSGDSNLVYPVFANYSGNPSTSKLQDCNDIPIAKYVNTWGTTDSTDFTLTAGTGLKNGIDVSTDTPCPCVRFVVANVDSSAATAITGTASLTRYKD